MVTQKDRKDISLEIERKLETEQMGCVLFLLPMGSGTPGHIHNIYDIHIHIYTYTDKYIIQKYAVLHTKYAKYASFYVSEVLSINGHFSFFV